MARTALRLALNATPSGTEDAAFHYHDKVVPIMEKLRENADYLEQMTDKSYWPYPIYSDLLFY